MLESLPGWLGSWSPPALLGLVVLLVISGRLVPGRTHDRALARIEKLETTLELRNEQIAELMELSRTTVAAIQALPKVRDHA